MANGGSASAYLRQARALEAEMSVTLVGYCLRQGQPRLHIGTAPAKVKVVILYNGDPRIEDGVGPNSSANKVRGQVDKSRRIPR